MENKPTTSKIIQLKTIVTNNYEFIIPIYQRLYSWNEKQIIELLDDIKNAGDEYFIGNVVICKKDGFYHLVDGQQRLSTILFLCIWYCKNKTKNSNEIPSDEKIRKIFDFAFLENNTNKNHYDRCRIQMPLRKDDENALFWYKFDEIKNPKITNVLKVFDEHLKDSDEFFTNLLEKVKINFIELGSGINLNEYFVRMNSTGVKLSPVDILKARLLSLLQDEYNTFANIFDECSQMGRFADFSKIEQNENPKLTIANILKHSYDDKVKKDENTQEYKSIIDFPTFILHVFKILFGNEIKIDKKKFLENTWDKVKDGLDSKKAKDIIKALKEYRIVFDKFVIKNDINNDENEYFIYNDDFSDDKLSDLEIIQNYLRVARRGDNNNYHHFLTNLLRYAKDNPYPDKIYLYLKNLDTALAYELLDKNNDNTLLSVAEEFQGEAKECHMPKSCFEILDKGTNTQHYWFYRLEYYLLVGDYFKDEQGCIKDEFKSAVENYRFRYLNSVEHIYPQSKSDEIYKDDSGRIDCFGNLALISKNQNSSFSNKDFWEKQAQFYALKSRNDISSLKLLDFYSVEIEKDKSSEEIAKIIQDKIQSHQKAMTTILENSFKS